MRAWFAWLALSACSVTPAMAQRSAKTPPPAPPAALGTWSQSSWYSDRRPLQLGEPVTLLVAEDWLSRDRLEERGERSRETGVGASGLGLGSASGSSSSSARSARVGTESRGLGLEATLTGRVIARDPAGWMTVEATRTLVLNKRRQVLTVRGVIRPDDIGPNNTIQAARLANAELALDGKPVSAAQSIVGKLVGALWP